VEVYLHSATGPMACIGAVVPLRLPRTSIRNMLRTVCVVLYAVRSVCVLLLYSRTPYTCLDLITNRVSSPVGVYTSRLLLFVLIFIRPFFLCCIRKLHRKSRDSSVGIATRYGMGGPGIKSRWGARYFAPSRPIPKSTQPAVRWPPIYFQCWVANGLELYLRFPYVPA